MRTTYAHSVVASGQIGEGAKRVLVRLFTSPEGIMAVLMAWQYRARERAQLANLEAHRLDDMGIGAADAAREAAKPFWQD